MVGWESFATDASGDVAYRTFRANGTSTMAVDGQVNVTTGYQQDISVVGLTGGSFAIGWNEGNTAVTGLGSSTAAMVRSLDGTGALGAAFRISGNWGGDDGPRLAFDNTFFGTPYFLAVWDDSSGPSIDLNGNDGIDARLLEGPPLPTSNFADGGIRIDSGPFREASVDPDVAVAGAGAIVVWDDIYSVTVGRDILLSRNSSLSRAKTTMTGDQVQAAVAALPDGGFVVVWCDLAGTGGGDIRGRVHDAAGLPTSDTDFLVTKAGTASAGVQFNPDVTALIDGRFMVSWSDATTGLGIQGRIFDARTAPPVFAGKADGERIYGTNFAASDIIDGDAGDNRLDGGDGGDGGDLIAGGDGFDTLTGGAMSDTFVYNTIDPTVIGRDQITDFESGTDTITLQKYSFNPLGATLDFDEFVVGTAALDGNDHLIYNAATRVLWWDADGNGAGQAVALCRLQVGATLDFFDFVYV